MGRGPLAGPVVVAAVIIPPGNFPLMLEGVRDSKELTPQARERLLGPIYQQAIAWGVGMASHQEVDDRGLGVAIIEAICRAVAQLDPSPQFLIVDGRPLPRLPWPHRGVVDGDALSLSIAAASIVAKVTRDRLMVEMDRQYPGYAFARNKGYGTAEHLACLQRLGPCPIHRRSFAPVQECR